MKYQFNIESYGKVKLHLYLIKYKSFKRQYSTIGYNNVHMQKKVICTTINFSKILRDYNITFKYETLKLIIN